VTQGLRERLRRWWIERHPLADSVTLAQGNIYIVPTRAGLLFAATLVTMLLASINYQLSLGYVLTFLLAGAGITSMHQTHATLRGLTLHLRPPAPSFAGEPAWLDVVLTSPARQRYGIGIGFDGDAEHQAWVDVPAAGQAVARVGFVPPHRGLHRVPTLRVETRFPLGLFRAWTVWRPAARALAWPRPEVPAAPLPPSHALAGESSQAKASDGGEYEGVRAYRRGDTLKRVVWKKVARSGELVSRDTSAAAARELWLDYQAAALPGVEQKLSRLAAWVVAADRAGVPHGLKLPGVEIAPAHGDGHRVRLLEALALWS
jgi:uncharacterized protein (DUF58 family)